MNSNQEEEMTTQQEEESISVTEILGLDDAGTVITEEIASPVEEVPTMTEEEEEFWGHAAKSLLIRAGGFLEGAVVRDPDALREWQRDYRRFMGKN